MKPRTRTSPAVPGGSAASLNGLSADRKLRRSVTGLQTDCSNDWKSPDGGGIAHLGAKTAHLENTHDIDWRAVDDMRPVAMEPFVQIDHGIGRALLRQRNDAYTAGTRAQHPPHFCQHLRNGCVEEFQRKTQKRGVKDIGSKAQGAGVADREGHVSLACRLHARPCNGHHSGRDIDCVHVASGADGLCQANQPVTCTAADLQHMLAMTEPNRPNPDVTDDVLTRIGEKVVDPADSIVETTRLVRCNRLLVITRAIMRQPLCARCGPRLCNAIPFNWALHYFSRWNGTLVTTTFGLNSSAPFISSAR